MSFSNPQPLKRIEAWSFSRYTTYQQCPRKAKLLYIDKHKTEESEAMKAGKDFHKLCEVYLKSKSGQVPEPLKVFEKQFKELRKSKGQSEQQWAFDRDWTLVEWFDRAAWVRLAIDALVVTKGRMRMIDFKTGKERDKDLEQLSLYALAGFQLDPSINTVSAELWYSKTGRVIIKLFKRKDLKKLLAQWTEDTVAMLSDEDFAPNPSYLCGYCQFNKDSEYSVCEF